MLFLIRPETNKVYYFTSDLDLVLRDLDNGTVETLLDAAQVVSNHDILSNKTGCLLRS